MSIRLDHLRDLDPTAVQQEAAILTEQLQEVAPEIDLRRGVLHDLLLYLSAVLGAKNQEEQARLQRSISIAAIQADPTLADTAAVDNIASNYRVTRREGTFAGGSVTIVMDILRDVTIPIGAEFTAQGKLFATEDVFTGRALESSVVAANDRLLVSRGDGTYEFKISVVALEEGEASRLVKDTALVPSSPPISFVSAGASEDFIGGLNEEENADLVARFAAGLTTKSISSRINMTAELREQFDTVLNDSIVGFGDPELVRGRHSIFPVSMGNRADWYVQTQALYRTYGATKSATFVEATSDGWGIWQMTFERDEYPGLYSVEVSPSTEETIGTFAITEVIRDLDLSELSTNDGFVPDIVTAEEGAFSRFQTVTVKFKDSLTSSTGLTVGVNEQDYKIAVLAMPLIADIQDYVLQRSVRNTAGDVLVKAPVPVYLSMSFVVQLMPGQATPSADLIADDLASFVNHNGFLGRMPASALLDIVHNHLEDDASIVDTDLIARLVRPDGTELLMRDSELLEIPNEPDLLVTARTALFFLNPADVTITFETAEILQVL